MPGSGLLRRGGDMSRAQRSMSKVTATATALSGRQELADVAAAVEALSREVWLLRRVLFKHKNQHRRTRHYDALNYALRRAHDLAVCCDPLDGAGADVLRRSEAALSGGEADAGGARAAAQELVPRLRILSFLAARSVVAAATAVQRVGTRRRRCSASPAARSQ